MKSPFRRNRTSPSDTPDLSKAPSDVLGLVRDRHFTEWVEPVKQLKRDGKHQEVIDLCLEVLPVAEHESQINQWGAAPPWWYEQVALAARRTDQPVLERKVMERYLAQPGRKNPNYVEKFEKNLAKLDSKEGLT